jgi:hypothetical protein
MATKVLVRRGLEADLDSQTLDEGELGFTTDELGLYVGSDTATDGYIKVNKTGNIEYEGNALTSVTDTDNLKEAVQSIDVALKTEQDNVGALQSAVGTANTNISTNASDISTLQTTMAVEQGNIDQLQTDVDAAEVNISTNTSNIATNTSNITPLSGNISSNTAAIQQNASNITSNASSISTNGSNISTNTSNISTNTSNISTNASGVSTNATAITTKQNTLVSGTNIKTVDGNNLLGSGNVTIMKEWEFVREINEDNVNTITLNSTNYSGLTYDTENYDYKFVINAYTSNTDTSGAMTIQVDGDSTFGRHSSLRNRTGFSSSGSFNLVEGNTTTASGMSVGVVLGSGTQGTQTIMHSEFTLSKGLSFQSVTQSDLTPLDFYGYIIQGKASIVSTPGVGQADTSAGSIASFSQQSDFTGSYHKPVAQNSSGNITSLKLSDLPDAGNSDKVKVRIYKRAR